MDATVLIVFAAVYAGMLLGEFPGLALDRAGVALLGATALVVTGRVTVGQAWDAARPFEIRPALPTNAGLTPTS